MTIPFVVLDSNVFISGLLFGGPPRRIMRMIGHSINCYTSPAILDEVRIVLKEPKFKLPAEQVPLLIEHLRMICQLKEPTERVDAVYKDVDDNKILECALAAHADVIITGDSHLLELNPWQGIRILSPADFLAEID